MEQKVLNTKRVLSLLRLERFTLDSIANSEKKGFFKQNVWHLSKRAKFAIVLVIIAIILVSTFAFLSRSQNAPTDPLSTPTVQPSLNPQATNNPNLNTGVSPFAQFFRGIDGNANSAQSTPQPTPHPPGVVTSAQTINNTVWRQVAANAWALFQPGVGVDNNTGLPYAAGTDFKAFTDWDLGSYIEAVIDAQKMDLVNASGTWGSYDRLNRVLTFLENRPLNTNTSYPFQFYDATTGDDYSSISNTITQVVDTADTGRLLVALNNLKAFNPDFASRIDNFVYNRFGNRSNYAALVPYFNNSASNNMYAYFIDSGFASFWPQQLGGVPSAILNNILHSQNITTNGVSLPNATICNEPLLGSIFELNNGDSNRLMGLMTQVYLAHEAYYNATGQFIAPSEGSTPYDGWLYEWVVGPNGQPWAVTTQDQTSYYSNFTPVIYDKVAFSFLALYNSTFAKSMVVWLEATLPEPVNGYNDGADLNGNVVQRTVNSNSLILDAALYALKK